MLHKNGCKLWSRSIIYRSSMNKGSTVNGTSAMSLIKPSRAWTHWHLQKVRSQNHKGLKDPPLHLHQGTPQGALAGPTLSDAIIGDPCEPTWAIYSEHMDFPIVRLGANTAAGLSSSNWARFSLTMTDTMIQISLCSTIAELVTVGSVPRLLLRSTHSAKRAREREKINNVSLMVLINYL